MSVRIRVPSIEMYVKLVETLRKEAYRRPNVENVLPLTLAVTGARVSEALSMTTADIDKEMGCVRILCLKKKHKGIFRYVPVPLWYIGIIEDYIVRNMITHVLFPISRWTAWIIVKRKTGYPPHALRHAWAMYCLYKGVDPEIVRRWLGDSTWRMVEYYVKVVGVSPALKRSPLEEL